MRKVAYAVFFVLFAIAIVVILGGNPLSFMDSKQQATESKVNLGFTAKTQSEESGRINFNTFAPNIKYTGVNWEDDNAKNISQTTAESTNIFLIRGRDLDANANATLWLVVISQNEQVTLVSHNYYGEKITPWQGKHPEREIDLSNITTPSELFAKNKEIIFPTPDSITTETRDLDLAADTYYLTITNNGKTRNLEFDAKTGALK